MEPEESDPGSEGTGQRFGTNADLFISFLRRLPKQTKGRKIFVIDDGHPSHEAKKVQSFVTAIEESLRLTFLPPYSPELNPDELAQQRRQIQCLRTPPTAMSSSPTPAHICFAVRSNRRSLPISSTKSTFATPPPSEPLSSI